MTGKILGHYEVLEELGAGGMGQVYKAKDTHLDRLVAIKVLRAEAVSDPERIRRFVLEAKAASALNHPNIVTIHDIAKADGVDYIVMEHVAGRTLDRLIARGGMKLADLLRYAVQAADALAKAHEAGIVHRDLKPSNVMVTADGRVKILDFGLAKLASSAISGSEEMTVQHDPAKTGDGWVVGTPAYMSPEQAEGKTVDARSDIFSFGAVLYEMATGTSPFRGESAASTLAAVLTSTPAPPSQASPHLPQQLERVIVRCLRKDPSRRYQHMSDLAVELDDIQAESGDRTEVAKAPAAVRSRSGPSNPWLKPALAVAVIVLIAAVATAMSWRRAPASPTAGPPAIVPLTTYQGVESMASLSPDGNDVAFVWPGDKQYNLDVYVKPVDAVTPLRITTDPLPEMWPAWSPTGRELSFVRVQRDDRYSIYVTPPIPGSERRIGEFRRVETNNTAAPSWTPDGKWLVVPDLGPGDGENGIFLISVDSGERRPIVTAARNARQYAGAVVSPSGTELAYVGCPRQGPCDLWLQPLGENFSRQGDARQLTDLNAVTTGLAWMPDGRSLVAAMSTSQNAFSHIYRVPLSAGAPARLDWAGANVTGATVSRTGGRLVVAKELGGTDVWRFDASGSGMPGNHPISSTLTDTDPDFSPDGTKIAFATARSGQEQEIWIGGSDGSGLVQLTRRAAGRNRGSPAWSHDGRRIVFDSSSEDGVRRAYIVDAAGGEPRLVSDQHVNFPIWSRDDKWIYFASNRTGRNEVWRAPADASAGGTTDQNVQITTEGGTAPRLSADGNTLFYKRGTTIYAKPLVGGAERPIVERVFGVSSAYRPFGSELFYLANADPARPTAVELRAIDLTTGKTRSISRFEATIAAGMTVSPDGKTVLTAIFKSERDLMLVENFQ